MHKHRLSIRERERERKKRIVSVAILKRSNANSAASTKFEIAYICRFYPAHLGRASCDLYFNSRRLSLVVVCIGQALVDVSMKKSLHWYTNYNGKDYTLTMHTRSHIWVSQKLSNELALNMSKDASRCAFSIYANKTRPNFPSHI